MQGLTMEVQREYCCKYNPRRQHSPIIGPHLLRDTHSAISSKTDTNKSNHAECYLNDGHGVNSTFIIWNALAQLVVNDGDSWN